MRKVKGEAWNTREIIQPSHALEKITSGIQLLYCHDLLGSLADMVRDAH